MAKKFGFCQFIGESGAIYGYKGGFGTTAAEVYKAGELLFSSTTFSQQKNGNIGCCCDLQTAQESLELFRLGM